MKKAYSDKRKSFYFLGLLAVCLSFFNISCGLDVLDTLLDDPFTTTETPYDTSEFERRTFYFSTSRLNDANEFGRGYVYYKIYNSSSVKESEIDNISTLVSDSSKRHESYTTLINNYSYKMLHYLNPTTNQDYELVLDNKAQNITIRLTNYYESTTDYSAKITINDTYVGIPLRFNGKTFDFGRNGEKDEKPVRVTGTEENETDVKRFAEEGDDGDNTFYVVLYGVFNMPTETFDKTIYSPVHLLGEVRINADSLDN